LHRQSDEVGSRVDARHQLDRVAVTDPAGERRIHHRRRRRRTVVRGDAMPLVSGIWSDRRLMHDRHGRRRLGRTPPVTTFAIVDCKYMYNLATTSLRGVSTYKVSAIINEVTASNPAFFDRR
jgi:hypothetical protein